MNLALPNGNMLLPTGHEMMPNGYNLGVTANTPISHQPFIQQIQLIQPIQPLQPLPHLLSNGNTLLSNGQEMTRDGYNLGYTSRTSFLK